MLNLFRRLFIRQTKYYSWSAYKERINFLDVLAWQQHIRTQSIKNLC